MNKLMSLAGFIFSISLSACGQRVKTENVPPPALTAFESKYPGISNAKWEKEGTAWEVNFESDEEEMSAIFESDGRFREAEKEIEKTDLPAAILNYLDSNYNGRKVKEAAMITKADGTIEYEAELKEGDLIFDQSGNFIKLLPPEKD